MSCFPKVLRCSSCDALLHVGGRVREGDVIICEYCGSENRMEDPDQRTTRYPRTSNFTVVNSSYYDHRRYQMQEYNYYGALARPVAGGWSGELEALAQHEAWLNRECESTRCHRQHEQEARKRFSVVAAKFLLITLPITFVLALVQLSEAISTACFVLCGVGTMFLIAILGGAFNLKVEDMEVAQDEARVPLSSTMAQGMDYKDVVTAFEEAGFVDVRPKALRDLGIIRRVLGSSEGRVAEVRIGKVNDFEKGSIFLKSSMVFVRYHSKKSFWG